MYTIEKRKLIYIMTRKPVWVHRHCLTPGPGTPIWYDPFWVIGNCELCKMDIEAEELLVLQLKHFFLQDMLLPVLTHKFCLVI